MLNLEDENDKKAYDELVKMGTSLRGTNFGLAMRLEDGTVETHRREKQPCQGGEMRKYKTTHGDLCTRPDDPRPGDLRHPFPDGTVEAVVVKLNRSPGTKVRDEMIEAFFSEGTPYQKGFGAPSDVHFVRDGNDHISAVIWLNTEIDPTVLVNSIQFLLSRAVAEEFKKYTEAGLTTHEAFALMLVTGSDISGGAVLAPCTYYFSVKPSLRRILEADPFDLSGGTYRNGYDYNRPQISNLWDARDDEEIFDAPKKCVEAGLVQEIMQEYRGFDGVMRSCPALSPLKFEEFVPVFKKWCEEVLKKEVSVTSVAA